MLPPQPPSPHPPSPYRQGLLVAYTLVMALLLAGAILAMAVSPQRYAASQTAYGALYGAFEISAVVVAMMIFATGWITTGRPQMISTMLLTTAFMATGLLDALHLIVFAQMTPFAGPASTEQATFFWLAARLLTALALLQLSLCVCVRPAGSRLRTATLAGGLGLVGLIAWVGIWHIDWLPHTFVPGRGFTPLKLGVEYLIAGIFLAAAALLVALRRLPAAFSEPRLLAALVTLAASTICFALNGHAADGFALLGHSLKLLADIFLYVAIFVGAVRAPYQELATAYARLEREQAALQASEARFRALDASIEEIIFTLDLAGRHTDIYGLGLHKAGVSPEVFLGRTSREVLGPEAGAAHEAASARALAGEPALYDWSAETPSGLRYYQTSLAPLRDASGQITGLIGLGRDVTERRRAEEALRERNRELKLLNRVIVASAASASPAEILAAVCRELALAFEIPRALAALTLLTGVQTRLVVTYPDEGADRPTEPEIDALLERVTDAREALLLDDGAVRRLALPVILGEVVAGVICLEAPRGPWAPESVQLAESVVRQAAGALARARLTQSHQLLSAAVAQAGESIVITDVNGTIIAVNPTFERMSGYTQQEAFGQNPRILKSGLQDGTFYRRLWATLARGEIWRGRFVNRRKDGSFYTEDATITPIRSPDGVVTHYVAVKRDVTHMLQLEAQFRQAQKMEAVGRLAGGIAHDFNNLLSVINGYGELLLEVHSNPDDPAHQDVEAILHAGTRASGLTRQLLAFSRRQALQPQVLDVNAVLVELEKLLRRLIGEHITVELRLTPGLWPVYVDRGQLEQVVMNLAVNARDAMPAGGRLTFSTSMVVPDGMVRIEAEDTGEGMSETTLEHLFEPFYTTKESGRGTGLGLATVHGIITQSGGFIAVESALGKGARFIIDLPRYRGGEVAHASPPAAEPSPPGQGTILLVEDEQHIRTLTARVLRGQGYEVLEAADAATAIERHAATPTIDLLLTDIVMPGMSGMALADELRRRQPGLRVLFMSGYPDHACQAAQETAPILMKPLSSAILAEHVRAALAAPQL